MPPETPPPWTFPETVAHHHVHQHRQRGGGGEIVERGQLRVRGCVSMCAGYLMCCSKAMHHTPLEAVEDFLLGVI